MEDDKIFQILRKCGAKVVADDLCNYSRYFSNLIEESHPPIEAIARRYLTRIPCPRMVNSSDKVKEIVETIKQDNLSGAIYYSLKFCDQALSDMVNIQRVFKKADIPLLLLVCESSGNYGQIKTRIEAFLESIKSLNKGGKKNE